MDTEKLEGDLDRLERFEERQLAILEQVREVKARLDSLNGSVSDILAELGGAPTRTFRDPTRKTIRRRIHDLENDRASALIARAALESAELTRRQTWSRREKVLLFVFATFAFISSTVSAIEGFRHLLNIG